MNKLLIVALFSFFLPKAETPTLQSIHSVMGKTYLGAPIGKEVTMHNEGTFQRGTFKFLTTMEVEFIWPGSDIMDGGTYEQEGDKVTINSMNGRVYTFKVLENGKDIIDNTYGITLRDQNFSWEEYPKKTIKEVPAQVRHKVKGNTYLGAPRKKGALMGSPRDLQRGAIKFLKFWRVEFTWPQNDVVNTGWYRQKGDQVRIKSTFGQVFTFKVLENGKDIVALQSGVRFRNQNYAWEECVEEKE